MSGYLLVSLWAEDDASTRISHQFACRLHERRAARRFLSGESPSLEALQEAAAANPEAAVVILGHGGPALSARAGGPVWMGAEQLAQILSGRRVYAFACSTFVPHASLFWSHFAERAVRACIRVFVGHEAPVMAPLAAVDGAHYDMYGIIVDCVEAFLDGEDDQAALVDRGRMQVDWELPVELDLPSEDPEQIGALGWSSAAFLGGFFKSLRVERKAL